MQQADRRKRALLSVHLPQLKITFKPLLSRLYVYHHLISTDRSFA